MKAWPRQALNQDPPIEETRALARRWTEWVRTTPAADLGEGLIGIRETGIDSLEAVFAEGVRRFDRSGEYAADGALGIVPWLRWKCKLSKGAANERVIIGRQLEQLTAWSTKTVGRYVARPTAGGRLVGR